MVRFPKSQLAHVALLLGLASYQAGSAHGSLVMIEVHHGSTDGIGDQCHQCKQDGQLDGRGSVGSSESTPRSKRETRVVVSYRSDME